MRIRYGVDAMLRGISVNLVEGLKALDISAWNSSETASHIWVGISKRAAETEKVS